jgi:hypothetical protein
MANGSRPLIVDRDDPLSIQGDGLRLELDLFLGAAPESIMEDEVEVYDLGFIIEDRSDDRAFRWQHERLSALAPRNRLAEIDEVLFAARNGMYGDLDR